MDSLDKKDSSIELIQTLDMGIVADFLRTQGVVSYLCIDASSLKKMEIEYGRPIYLKLKSILHTYLLCSEGLKAKLGSCFKFLFKKSEHENIFFIIFNRHESDSLKQLGGVEKLCDNITLDLHNYMRGKIQANQENIMEDLGSSITNLPYASIAYCESIYNPCLNTKEIIEKGIRSSQNKAASQTKRIKNLQKELIHTLITQENLLYPNFQAVVNLQEVSDEDIRSFSTSGSNSNLSTISEHIYGFEALIRINTKLISQQLDLDKCVIHPEYLNPELLFYLAREANASLELDQLCIKRIYELGFALPGYLMINVLPRNLYRIDELNNYFIEQCPNVSFISNDKIIFEISETEAIANLSLMKETLGKLQALNIKIATDDFGNGFSGLRQLIQIQPNIIKLDKSLITDIQHSPLKQAYVEGILNVSRLTSIQVLAEGVETAEEALTLKRMGIELVQGFLFHKPQSLETIINQLQKTPQMIEVAS